MAQMLNKCIIFFPPVLKRRVKQWARKMKNCAVNFQFVHPCRLIAIFSPSSRFFGPPRRVDHSHGKCIQIDLNHFKNIDKSGYTSDTIEVHDLSMVCRYKEVQSFTLKKARVCGIDGAIITQKDELLGQASLQVARVMGTDTAYKHSIFSRMKLGQTIKYNGRAASIAASGADVYFHWLFDVLPRMFHLRNEEVDYYVVGKIRHAFQSESLSILLNDNHLLEVDKQQLEFDELVCCGNIAYGAFDPSVLEYLRSAFLSKISRNENKRRIYLSRQAAKTRKIENYSECLMLLAKFGIEEIRVENYSFLEQVEIFQSAEIVFGPHGSGFSNLVFCDPGTKVIELYNQKYINPLFYNLAISCKHEYSCIIDRSNSADPDSGNICVDLKILEEQLTSLLN